MAELFSAIPQLAGLIEKGGIIGLLVIIAAVLIWEVRRLRAELSKCYRERDRWRLAFVRCKGICDAAGTKIDLSDLADLMGEAA